MIACDRVCLQHLEIKATKNKEPTTIVRSRKIKKMNCLVHMKARSSECIRVTNCLTQPKNICPDKLYFEEIKISNHINRRLRRFFHMHLLHGQQKSNERQR